MLFFVWWKLKKYCIFTKTKTNTMTTDNTEFYTKMYIESLERLSMNVVNGDVTPKRTAEQILEMTKALRELHKL